VFLTGKKDKRREGRGMWLDLRNVRPPPLNPPFPTFSPLPPLIKIYDEPELLYYKANILSQFLFNYSYPYFEFV
jgi:hypothetical protein